MRVTRVRQDGNYGQNDMRIVKAIALAIGVFIVVTVGAVYLITPLVPGSDGQAAFGTLILGLCLGAFAAIVTLVLMLRRGRKSDVALKR